MKRSLLLMLIFSVLVGGVVATVAAVTEAPPENLTCLPKRVVVYGWTSERLSLAELAAITKWQERVKSAKPGFDHWHQAYKRRMNCRLFKDSKHYQCEVSATPCQLKKV